ncbi:MAG: vitamin K epoxide reductase family protein [Terriglobia bacterium]|nr:vitamin K epoxide reductase family protein [Terriglobia bacterium]
MKNKLTIAIVLLCCAGGILSGVSLWNHYSASATEYCDLSEMFNCDLVNRSIYSVFMGVPVALIGLLGYVFLAAVSFLSNRWWQVVRLLASLVGFGFALYLAYIEARVLVVWCLLCIGSMISIGSIFVLSVFPVWKRSKSGREITAGPKIPATEMDEG